MKLATRVYAQLARTAHALAEPTRLYIVNLLLQSERSVDELSEMIGHSAPNTSAHLKVLQSVNLLSRRREGRRVFYSVQHPAAVQLWLALRDMGLEVSPDIREAMRSAESDDAVVHNLNPAELLARMQSGEVLLLDLRPAVEYRAGHIPNAKSIPVDELEERLSELDPNTPIIAYCRGPFCLGAIGSVATLRERGFQAIRLFGGVAEWLAEGVPLECSPAAVEAKL